MGTREIALVLFDERQRLQCSRCASHEEEIQMLRKTLVTLTAVAALGLGSAAMAAHGGEGGGGFGGGAGFGRSGGFGGAGVAAPSGSAAPMMMRGGSVGPMTRGGMMATA